MGYLIDNKPNQIVIAKVTLTPSNLLAPSIIDIPEYPAVKNYHWQVLSMTGHITGGAIPYVGASAVHIQSSTAPNLQFRFQGAYMSGPIDTWAFADINANANITQFVDNDKLQIHNPVALTLGDSNLDLYITAILIPT
jgi:hypothetical protein